MEADPNLVPKMPPLNFSRLSPIREVELEVVEAKRAAANGGAPHNPVGEEYCQRRVEEGSDLEIATGPFESTCQPTGQDVANFIWLKARSNHFCHAAEEGRSAGRGGSGREKGRDRLRAARGGARLHRGASSTPMDGATGGVVTPTHTEQTTVRFPTGRCSMASLKAPEATTPERGVEQKTGRVERQRRIGDAMARSRGARLASRENRGPRGRWGQNSIFEGKVGTDIGCPTGPTRVTGGLRWDRRCSRRRWDSRCRWRVARCRPRKKMKRGNRWVSLWTDHLATPWFCKEI